MMFCKGIGLIHYPTIDRYDTTSNNEVNPCNWRVPCLID